MSRNAQSKSVFRTSDEFNQPPQTKQNQQTCKFSLSSAQYNVQYERGDDDKRIKKMKAWRFKYSVAVFGER